MEQQYQQFTSPSVRGNEVAKFFGQKPEVQNIHGVKTEEPLSALCHLPSNGGLAK